MARILNALRNLQTLSPDLGQGQEVAPLAERPATGPSEEVLRQEQPVPQTIVLETAPQRPEQNELVEKLSRELAAALEQRDAVAAEVDQVRQKLETHGRRHEEEIIRLRSELQVHEQAAQTIEEQLKHQLARQQEEFAQKLGEFEKRLAEAQTPAAGAPVGQASPVPELHAPGLADARPLGSVFAPAPKMRLPEKQLTQTEVVRQVAAGLGQTPLAEELAELAGKILPEGTREGPQTPQIIFVGSCRAGDSTEPLVLRLAVWLSQRQQRVMLIDGALRTKRLSQTLGLRTSPGIYEMVRREVYPHDAVYHVPATGLAFIPAGKSHFTLSPNTDDGQALAEQLHEIIQKWPIVLISGEGPDLPASQLFAQLGSRTFLQVELGQTAAPEVSSAVETFRQIGIEPAGLIATGAAM